MTLVTDQNSRVILYWQLSYLLYTRLQCLLLGNSIVNWVDYCLFLIDCMK